MKKQPTGLKKFIRLEAVIPFVVIILLTVLYFTLFFDLHVRKGLEWGLTKALGVEVNIGVFETSFTKLTLKVQDIEVTDSSNPQVNVIKVGEVRFGALWDALLRAKIVVNEAVVEKIEFGSPRKSPGYVAPPEPTEEEKGPSAIEKLKDKSLQKLESKYDENVIGDAANWLRGDKGDPLDGLKSELASKELIEKFQKEVAEKQKAWDDRLKSLPQPKEFEELGQKISRVKTSGHKNPAEVVASVQELDGLIKEADSKFKALDSASKDLNADLKKIDQDVKTIQTQVRADVDNLEDRLRIPKLDSQSLAKSIFAPYIAPYQAQFFHYKALAEKYLPPNIMKKKDPNAPDESIQPRPRSKGVSYEFGKAKAYPVFWVKKTRVTSQAGTSPFSGNIEGEIRHISTNQLLSGEPTVAEIRGDFPQAQLQGLYTKLSFDNRKKDSLIDLQFDLNSYPVQVPRKLVESKDLSLQLTQSNARLNVKVQLAALKNYDISIQNTMTQFAFDVGAKDKVIKEVFNNALGSLPEIYISAKAAGTLPGLNLQIDSNLGRRLAEALQAELKAQVEKAKKEIQARIESEISKQRDALNAQVANLKNQVQGQIDKLQKQADDQKKVAQDKINASKKDTENKAKNQMQKEGEKALKNLKKKLKF